MINYTISADAVIDIDIIRSYIERHHSERFEAMAKLKSYYDGDHSILERQKSKDLANNRVVTNHAAYIADMASSYLIGSPVAYTSKSGADITALTDMLELADAATQDSDLALDASIYGRCYDLVYMSADKTPRPKLAKLSPLNAFVVYDETVEQNPVFGAYYYPIFDKNGNVDKYICSAYTASEIISFTLDRSFSALTQDEPQPHFFGAVPLDEIYNNQECRGDFAPVMSLIDAYNTLMSDRVNDKEQFVNALLVIYGMTFGDTDKARKAKLNAVQSSRYMELEPDARAEYLTRQFDEASLEVLRTAIKSDIHKISRVPDMSDENFAANASGVAMKYKLLGFELLAKTKERFFREGLRYRLRLFANIIAAQGGGVINVDDIEISFTRSLPANELESAQFVQTLNGIVPKRTLLSQLPFVEDVDSALDELEKENEEAVKKQQSLFANTPLVSEEKDDEE